MSALGRIFLVVESVILITAAAAIAIVSWNDSYAYHISMPGGTVTGTFPDSTRFVATVTAIAAFVGIGALIGLLLATIPSPRESQAAKSRVLTVKQQDGSTIEISARTVEN